MKLLVKFTILFLNCVVPVNKASCPISLTTRLTEPLPLCMEKPTKKGGTIVASICKRLSLITLPMYSLCVSTCISWYFNFFSVMASSAITFARESCISVLSFWREIITCFLKTHFFQIGLQLCMCNDY